MKKIHDISEFIKSKNLYKKWFEKDKENNPLYLLDELKTSDIIKRNEILEKLEKILETL